MPWNEYVDHKTILHVGPGLAKLNCAYMAVPSSLIVILSMGRREETCIPPGQHHRGALHYLDPEALVNANPSGMEPTEQTWITGAGQHGNPSSLCILSTHKAVTNSRVLRHSMDSIQIENGEHYNFTLKLGRRLRRETVEFKALGSGTFTTPDWMVRENDMWVLAGKIKVKRVGEKLIKQEVVSVVGCSSA
ncbi:hypothetical protein CEP54_013150 [Fusarium duplospermum]|uniref:Uncharacterized protein n=1 Tax=Fusarium duplospermum TaxID=1325734 RepID=A0A428P4J3_9HYPO|nr:hypothetical protein CEP54_013150 [Fusarium duplospermum]